MKGRFLRIVGATAALLSVVSMAGAAPSWLSQGTPTSYVRVMNVGNDAATMQVDYFHATDAGLNQSKVVPNVAVNVGAAFAPGTVPGFPANWTGSAVAAADQEIAATSYVGWANGGYNGDAAGYAGYSGIGAPASEYYLPLIGRRQQAGNEEHSAITIQNADSSPVNVTIYFYDRNTGAEIAAARTNLAINPNLQKTVNTTTLAGLPENTLASARVVAAEGKKIAVVGTTYANLDPEMYNGITAGGTKLYYARVLRLQNPDNTYREYSGIVVQNLSSSETANVRVTWFDRNGAQKLQFTDSIPAFTSHGYNTRWKANIPEAAWSTIDTTLGDDFLGSVLIESINGVQIAGLNRNWHNEKKLQNAFNAQTAGTSELYFPYFYRRTNGDCTTNGGGNWLQDTGLVIQNLGTAAANIKVEFFALGGAKAYEFTDTVQPNSSRGYNSRYIAYTNWPNGSEAHSQLGCAFDGTVKVTSTNGQNVIGVGFVTFNGQIGAMEYDAYNK